MKGDRDMFTPRQIIDAADYVDTYGDGSDRYCPMGLSEATGSEIDSLMVAAIAAGYRFSFVGDAAGRFAAEDFARDLERAAAWHARHGDGSRADVLAQARADVMSAYGISDEGE